MARPKKIASIRSIDQIFHAEISADAWGELQKIIGVPLSDAERTKITESLERCANRARLEKDGSERYKKLQDKDGPIKKFHAALANIVDAWGEIYRDDNDFETMSHLAAEIEVSTGGRLSIESFGEQAAEIHARMDGYLKGLWEDFLAHRKSKRAALTPTALNAIRREAAQAGISLEDALAEICARGWTGFKAAWITDQKGSLKNDTRKQRLARETADLLARIGQSPAG